MRLSFQKKRYHHVWSICSTTFGDEVCKGWERFSHEIVNWTKYSLKEREIINDRLENIKNLKLKFFKIGLKFLTLRYWQIDWMKKQ